MTDKAKVAVFSEIRTKHSTQSEHRVDFLMLNLVVGPCHHGMARPQVADRGTASDKEGSCE